MIVWRYTALERHPGQPTRKRQGELAARTSSEVRASLRRIGLQVVALRPLRAGGAAHADATAIDDERPWRRPLVRLGAALRARAHDHLRRRRVTTRAELYDGMATMLASGTPLTEAVATLLAATRRGRSGFRTMLMHLAEALKSGTSFGDAMAEHPAWFDGCEVAMVRAGEHGGQLERVLVALADRHERSAEIGHRLASALVYPAIVATVGVAVALFLSVKILPTLSGVLRGAGLPTPGLTRGVMAFGETVVEHWPALCLGGIVAPLVLASSIRIARTCGVRVPRVFRRLRPRLWRRIAVSNVSRQLAQLLQTGVPMVEALRVVAPTSASSELRAVLMDAADAMERGEELSAALVDDHWFDAEYRRLLEIGQSTGELDALLERIGERYARQARRLIDRLTTVLEPAVILALAGLVGVVVMAAVLPMLQLQEIL